MVFACRCHSCRHHRCLDQRRRKSGGKRLHVYTYEYDPRHFFPLRCELPVGPGLVPREHFTGVPVTTYSIYQSVKRP
jgi:hypothetical protein